jgi:uncharacterized membrane protein YbhN (UPF0104 family)
MRLHRRHPGLALKVLKALLFFFVVAWVSVELWERLRTDSLESVVIDWPFLLAGGLVAFVSLAFFAVIYRGAESLVRRPVPWLPAALVAWISPLGKYLPGKIGSVLGGLWIYRKFGVGASVATAVLILSSGSGLAACALLLLPFAAAETTLFEPLGIGAILAWTVIGVGLVFAFPRLLVLPVNLILRWLDRAQLFLVPPFLPYIGLILLGVAQLVITGTAFWLTANAVADVGWGDWYRMTAAYTIAGVIGMLAVFAPGGLGVREGVLLLLLGSLIEGQELALLVVLMRLSLVVCEVLLAAGGIVLWRSMPDARRGVEQE